LFIINIICKTGLFS